MPKFEVDIRDFLRTGEFGPIRLGMTKTEVELLLSKPRYWGGHLPPGVWEEGMSYNDCPIWEYDSMEFHFGYKGQLFLIHCDHLDWLENAGDTFSLKRWVFETHPLTLEQLEQALKEEQIDYIHEKPVWFGELLTEGDVEIAYEYDDSSTVAAISNYDGSYVGMPDNPEDDAT